MRNFIAVLLLATLARFGWSQSFNTIYTFPDLSAGYGPLGTPYIGAGGILYGTTNSGGTLPCGVFPIGCGTVFSLSPPAQKGGTWTEAVLYDFQGATDGVGPSSGVLPGLNGTLLGTTTLGGIPPCMGNCGTFFQLTPPARPGGAWTEQVLVDFTVTFPQATGLVMGNNGVLYGADSYGGRGRTCDGGCGSVYGLQPPAQTGGSWTFLTISGFPSTGQGSNPNPPVAVGPDGVLYGTVFSGGVPGGNCGEQCGQVFSLTPPQPPATTWTRRWLYRFKGGTDGHYPLAGVVRGADGTLYGTTYFGGASTACNGSGCGTVFSLTPPAQAGGQWTETVVYSFQGEMMRPTLVPLTQIWSSDRVESCTVSHLFGGGSAACSGGCGVLYQLAPPTVAGGAWTETVLHAFTGGADGQSPGGAPAIDPSGTLYGLAGGGTGNSCDGMGCGVVYQYIPR